MANTIKYSPVAPGDGFLPAVGGAGRLCSGRADGFGQSGCHRIRAGDPGRSVVDEMAPSLAHFELERFRQSFFPAGIARALDDYGLYQPALCAAQPLGKCGPPLHLYSLAGHTVAISA